jgi:hypothetical protein
MNRQMMNELRAFYFMLAVMETRQNDPFCGSCAAYARAVGSLQENFIRFESGYAPKKKDLPEEHLDMFKDVYDMISIMGQPEEPVRQKKAGNCKLPEGVCFIKAAMDLFKKVSG